MLYLLVALAIYHIAVNNGSVNGCDDVRNGVAVPYYHVRVLAHFKAAYAVANAGICGGIDGYGLPCFLLRQSVAYGKARAKGQRLYGDNRVVRYYCKGYARLMQYCRGFEGAVHNLVLSWRAARCRPYKRGIAFFCQYVRNERAVRAMIYRHAQIELLCYAYGGKYIVRAVRMRLQWYLAL